MYIIFVGAKKLITLVEKFGFGYGCELDFAINADDFFYCLSLQFESIKHKNIYDTFQTR